MRTPSLLDPRLRGGDGKELTNSRSPFYDTGLGKDLHLRHFLAMPEPRQFFVYMLASQIGGTLYVGVTNNLPKRVWEHKQGVAESFTKRHNIKNLVWFEAHQNIEAAIGREKQIKKWNRAWRIRLIEEKNPHWQDLYAGLM